MNPWKIFTNPITETRTLTTLHHNQSFFLSPSSDWPSAGVAAFPENGQDRLPLAVAVPFEAGHALLPSLSSVFLSVPSVTLPHGFQSLRMMGCKKRCQMKRRTGTTMQGMQTIAAAAVGLINAGGAEERDLAQLIRSFWQLILHWRNSTNQSARF